MVSTCVRFVIVVRTAAGAYLMYRPIIFICTMLLSNSRDGTIDSQRLWRLVIYAAENVCAVIAQRWVLSRSWRRTNVNDVVFEGKKERYNFSPHKRAMK